MVFGNPSPAAGNTTIRDSVATSWPVVAFAGLVLLLGVYLPLPLADQLREAPSFLQAGRPG